MKQPFCIGVHDVHERQTRSICRKASAGPLGSRQTDGKRRSKTRATQEGTRVSVVSDSRTPYAALSMMKVKDFRRITGADIEAGRAKQHVLHCAVMSDGSAGGRSSNAKGVDVYCDVHFCPTASPNLASRRSQSCYDNSVRLAICPKIHGGDQPNIAMCDTVTSRQTSPLFPLALSIFGLGIE
jgi:hypothetical protein